MVNTAESRTQNPDTLQNDGRLDLFTPESLYTMLDRLKAELDDASNRRSPDYKPGIPQSLQPGSLETVYLLAEEARGQGFNEDRVSDLIASYAASAAKVLDGVDFEGGDHTRITREDLSRLNDVKRVYLEVISPDNNNGAAQDRIDAEISSLYSADLDLDTASQELDTLPEVTPEMLDDLRYKYAELAARASSRLVRSHRAVSRALEDYRAHVVDYIEQQPEGDRDYFLSDEALKLAMDRRRAAEEFETATEKFGRHYDTLKQKTKLKFGTVGLALTMGAAGAVFKTSLHAATGGSLIVTGAALKTGLGHASRASRARRERIDRLSQDVNEVSAARGGITYGREQVYEMAYKEVSTINRERRRLIGRLGKTAVYAPLNLALLATSAELGSMVRGAAEAGWHALEAGWHAMTDEMSHEALGQFDAMHHAFENLPSGASLEHGITDFTTWTQDHLGMGHSGGNVDHSSHTPAKSAPQPSEQLHENAPEMGNKGVHSAQMLEHIKTASNLRPGDGLEVKLKQLGYDKSDWGRIMRQAGPELHKQGLSFRMDDGNWGLRRASSDGSQHVKAIMKAAAKVHANSRYGS
jgi:hypothetical protein